MRIETEEYLDFSQVLLKPKRSKLASRKEADVTRDFSFLYAKKSGDSFCPIIASNMASVGTIEASKTLREYDMLCALHKFHDKKQLTQYFKSRFNNKNFYTMGMSDEAYEEYWTLSRLIGYCPNVCIDIANGYSEKFVSYVSKIRDFVEDRAIIMAGNVATAEITEELILSGADIVKVGIGSGAMCTTRYVTGVGVPQFSAAIECADAAHGVGGMICSDGGIVSPADVVKAFGAGADFVMIGSQFAGHDENITKAEFKSYVNDLGNTAKIYGMSSSYAQEKHYKEKKDYRASEGRVAEIKQRGPLKDTIKYYLGGLRSGMTYIGAKSIKDIPKRATFIKVSNILNESHSKDTIGIR